MEPMITTAVTLHTLASGGARCLLINARLVPVFGIRNIMSD